MSIVSEAKSSKNDDISIKEISTRGDSVATQLPNDCETNDGIQRAEGIAQYDPEKALLEPAYRKMDFRLLLFYCIVQLFMKLSARNITNAAIINIEQGTGIKKQLGNLTSAQWAWVLSIFYYPHMVFEPISTIAVKVCRPDRWMGRILITWVSHSWIWGP